MKKLLQEKLRHRVSIDKVTYQNDIKIVQPSFASKILQRHFNRLYQCIEQHSSMPKMLCKNLHLQSTSIPLVEIQGLVHDDHKYLEKLGKAIQNLPGIGSLSSDILNDYYDMYVECSTIQGI